jgi:hypothetical protein
MSNIKLVHSGGNSVSLTTPTNNPSNNVTFKLPESDGSAGQVLQTDGNGNLSWVTIPTVTPGITMMDQWRLANNLAVGANSTTGIYSGWERNDNNFAQIGSGMTESSGVFTFPATGIYRVDCRWNVFATGSNNRYVSIRTELSTDGGSSYNQIAVAFTNIPNLGETLDHATSDFVVDVTNASNFKIRTVASSNFAFTFAGNTWAGINANVQTNSMTFMKIGDT